MGGQANAVVYGVRIMDDNDPFGDESFDKWDNIATRYNKGRKDLRIHVESNAELIGFHVAMGGSCCPDNCQDLNETFPLNAFLKVDRYKKAADDAKTAWGNFVDWLRKNEGLWMPEPQLWMCEIEVG